ncbi:hypothetical protein ACFPOE_11350 [Caenimonas terrae]|uniref:Bacteriophage tail tape measure N-terminal domain-containing protein n=1 Tax=Caenimonas terrae TaxID=696074 RepID=A0ABW0NDS2_9BURK
MSEASIVLSAIDNTKASFDSVKASLGTMRGTVAGLQSSLVGLGAALGVISTAMSVKGVIQGAAELDKLSKQAGIAVESLSGLAVVGKATSTGADQIATASNKLSKSLATSTEESKGAAAALKALGLSFDGFQKMAPDQRMRAVADAMAKFEDGGQKSAAAMMLFGKAGAELLPFLKDLAATGELHAKVTAEQAVQAHEFEVALIRLDAQSNAWKRTLAMALLPTLNDILQTVIELRGNTSALGDLLAGGVKDALQTVAVLGVNLVYIFKETGIEIGGMVAQLQALLRLDFSSITGSIRALSMVLNPGNAAAALITGNWKAFNSISQEMKTDAAAARVEVDKLSNSLLGLTNSRAGAGRGTAADPRALGPIAKDDWQLEQERLKLNGDGKANSEYEKLVKQVNERIAQQEKELAMGRELTEQEKFEVKILADIDNAKKSLTDTEKAYLEQKLKQSNVDALALQMYKQDLKNAGDIARQVFQENAELAADDKARKDARDALNQSLLDQTKALQDNAAQLDLEGKMLGATDRERVTAMENLRIDTELQKQKLEVDKNLLLNEEARVKARAQLDANAATAKAQFAEREGLKEQLALLNQVESEGKQLWDTLTAGGTDTFKKIGQSLKTFLLDELYALVAKRWVLNIGANISQSVVGGGGGMAAAGSNIGGLGNLVSAGSSLGGIGSAISTGFTAGSAASVGVDAFGVGSVGSAGGIVAGMGEAVSAGLAAIGPVGWVALAAIAAYSIFGSGGHGPKTEGGYAPAGLDIQGRDIGGNLQGSQRGDVASAMSYADGISAAYASLANTMGLAKKALDVGVFFAKDPNGTSQTQLQVTSSAGYNRGALMGGIENVGRSDAEFQTAVTDATSQLLLNALKNSDLASQYKAILNQVADNADAGTIQTAINRVTAAKTQQAQLEDTLFQLTATDLEKLNKTRAAERAAVDPLNAALLEQVYARQDAIRAEQDATAAAQQATAAAEAQAKAQDALRAATVAANQALDTAVNSAMSAYASALQATVSQLQSTVSTQQGYADALKQFRLALTTGPLAALSPEAQYNATKAEFNRLSSLPVGSDERMAGLQNAGQAFLQASQSYNASSMAYFSDLAAVKGTVQASEGAALTAAQIARIQLTTAQSQLDVLQGIKANTASAASLLSSMTSALIAQIKGGGFVGATVNPAALAAVTGGTTGVVNTVGGGVTSYTSAAGAFATFSGNTNAIYAKDGSYVGTASSVTTYIRQLFDAGDYQGIYDGAKRLGISLSDVDTLGGFAAGSSNAWATSKGLPSFAVGTPFVPRDMVAQIHQGERILTNTQNRDITANSAAVVEELRALKAICQRQTEVIAEYSRQDLANGAQAAAAATKVADTAQLQSVRAVTR